MPVLTLISLILSTKDETYLSELQSMFYVEFRQKVYTRCAAVAQKRFGHSPEWREVAEDTVQETFLFAIRNLDKFKSDKFWTEELAVKKVTSWLSEIASHKVLDYYAAQKSEKDELDRYKYDLKMGLQKGKTSDPKKFRIVERAKLEEAMSKLTAIQKDVLLTYIEHDCFINSQKHLPTDIMDMICKKYNKTSTNIRQLKKRAWDRVQKNCFNM